MEMLGDFPLLPVTKTFVIFLYYSSAAESEMITIPREVLLPILQAGITSPPLAGTLA